MEPRYQVQLNGQEVTSGDLNALGDASGLADDRVFAELLRMRPTETGTPDRGVLPYFKPAESTSGNAIVAPMVGGVSVRPFRAFVGSRNLESANAKENWRGVRSAIAVGTTTRAQSLALAAAPDNWRWDLVYATVTPDTPVQSKVLVVKRPETLTVAPETVVTLWGTTVAIGVVQGEPGGARPALPADTATEYRIGLAYVRVPWGFTSTDAIATSAIHEFAPCLSLAPSTGAAVMRPADQQHQVGGTVDTRTPFAPGSPNPRSYAPAHLPSTMTGMESIIVAMDLRSSGPGASHQSGDAIDTSRDWRKRLFWWQASAQSGASGGALAWDVAAAPAAPLCPAKNGELGATLQSGTGQSMGLDGDSVYVVAELTPANLSALAPGSSVKVYVDPGTGGAMRVDIAGAPDAVVVLRIDASGAFGNV